MVIMAFHPAIIKAFCGLREGYKYHDPLFPGSSRLASSTLFAALRRPSGIVRRCLPWLPGEAWTTQHFTVVLRGCFCDYQLFVKWFIIGHIACNDSLINRMKTLKIEPSIVAQRRNPIGGCPAKILIGFAQAHVISIKGQSFVFLF